VTAPFCAKAGLSCARPAAVVSGRIQASLSTVAIFASDWHQFGKRSGQPMQPTRRVVGCALQTLPAQCG